MLCGFGGPLWSLWFPRGTAVQRPRDLCNSYVAFENFQRVFYVKICMVSAAPFGVWVVYTFPRYRFFKKLKWHKEKRLKKYWYKIILSWKIHFVFNYSRPPKPSALCVIISQVTASGCLKIMYYVYKYNWMFSFAYT